MFGQISVRFLVEEITESGDVIATQVDDVMPTEGYIIIENGVSEAVRFFFSRELKVTFVFTLRLFSACFTFL